MLHPAIISLSSYQSSILGNKNWNIVQNRNLTFFRYSRHLEQADIQVKCPWGRARSYAGEAPVCLPADHRPKWEPPDLLQKGHRHYGSGASPHPR